MVADPLDVTTLVPALDDIESAFIVTPDFLDTQRGMINFIARRTRPARSIIPRYQLEHILGRKPVTFAEWLAEHKDLMLGKTEQKLTLKWSTGSPERVHEPGSHTPSCVRRSETTEA